MTNQFSATTPSESTEKPAEKAAPIGNQPSPAPVNEPAGPAPAVKS